MKDLNKFLQTAQKPLVVLLGPTASGKTALSLKIAHQINGEIISTDSRQIYRKMEIGTDAISPPEMKNIPHHLLEIADPDKVITMAEYRDLAMQKIREIRNRNHVPMLVGGTGLYISAIIEDYHMLRIPPDPQLRTRLSQEAEKNGIMRVYGKLQKLDPEAALTIHPHNLRYVIRAIEVALAVKNQQKLQNSQNSQKAQKPQNHRKFGEKFDLFIIGIKWPREELYKRIDLRVENQLKKGLVDEVKTLLSKGYDKNLPAMTSLGVKEIIPYLQGKTPLEACVENLKRNTRRYAKRQMTWFRRYGNVNWLLPDEL